MTDDLVAFINARLDEDEQAARAAIEPSEMHPWGNRNLPRLAPEQVPDEVRGHLGGTWGEHFARHDPARVLADVQAKRAIIARLGQSGYDWPESRVINAVEDDILRLMASVYADHPNFPQEWST